MTRFVLTHGAFHGSWCWERVAAKLRAGGHRVAAFDLPGSGDDRTPLHEVTLAAYTDRVVRELVSDPEPAVLVGHSMGGIPVTEAASRVPQSVAQTVYVSAFLPSDGESLMSLSQKPEGADGDDMIIDGDPPVARLPEGVATDMFYGECSPEEAAAAAQRLRPQAVLPFVTPVSLGQWPVPDRRYVVTLRDQVLLPALQRRMATDVACVEVCEIDTDHSPFLSRTDELSTLLSRFARS